MQERKLIVREGRRSFWSVYGGEKGRKERVGNGVRVHESVEVGV